MDWFKKTPQTNKTKFYLSFDASVSGRRYFVLSCGSCVVAGCGDGQF